MAKAIKHITAGLLHIEVIGTVPDRPPGRMGRAARSCATSPAQQFYNDKCSWRELELMLAGNFGKRALVLTLTYDILVHPGETERLYTWCESDIPTAAHMELYIANIAALRGSITVLPTTPSTPESMEFLDYIKANNIEKILVDINQLLINMAAAWFYSGEVYSGEVDA